MLIKNLKFKNKLHKQKSFTLIEILVVVSIFSIFAAGLGGVLSSGISLWKKAQNFGVVDANVLIELERFGRILRQAFVNEDIKFLGDKKSLEFGAVVNDSVLKLKYYFDTNRNEFFKKEFDYLDVVEGNIGKPVKKSIFKAASILFSYLVFDEEKRTYSWENSVDAEVPFAVKIIININNKKFEKYVFIPIHKSK